MLLSNNGNGAYVMENIIDLKPYLPAEPAAAEKPRGKFLSGIATVVESIVTVCIGVGFFIFLAAFLSVLY